MKIEEDTNQVDYIEVDELLKHLREGTPLEGATLADPENDSKEEIKRVVKAEVLRSVLTGRLEDEEKSVEADPRGLTLKNTRIDGELDLRYCDISFPIEFSGCRFNGPFLLHSASLSEISIVDSKWKLKSSKPQKSGEDPLPEASLPRILIDASGSTINGCLIIKNTRVNRVVSLTGASIKGNLQMTGSTIVCMKEQMKDKSIHHLFNAERVKIDGDVLFDGEFKALGLNMQDAKIGGRLCLNGAQIYAIGRTAINIDGSRIDGGIDIYSSNPEGEDPGSLFTCNGLLSIVDARVAGNFRMEKATLKAPKAPEKEKARKSLHTECALRADLIEVDGFVEFKECVSDGCISFAQARFGEQLLIIGGHLSGSRNALNAPDIKINSYARLGGSPPVEKTYVPKVNRLEGQSALNVTGSIDMRGAKIQGQLDLAEVKFVCKADSSDSSSAEGQQREKVLIDLSGANTSGLILPTGDGQAAGGANLSSASIDSLEITGLADSTGPDRATLFPVTDATGWRVGQVKDLHNEQKKVLKEWLADQPSAQPLRALADVAERYLNSRLARSWRFHAEKLERQPKAPPQPSKTKKRRDWLEIQHKMFSRKPISNDKLVIRKGMWRWLVELLKELLYRLKGFLYRFTSGYGYYPERIPLWIGALYLFSLGCSLLLEHDINDYMAERGLDKTIHFNPYAYALVVTVPAAGLFRMQTEVPAGADVLFSLLRVFGWIFTTLFLASITGLLRRGK